MNARAYALKSKSGEGTADRQAFSVLIREHHRSLLAYARALAGNETVAADLVQDGFVVAWSNLNRFDITRDFGGWMRGIVRNKWREHRRRNARQVDVDDATLEAWESQLAAWDENRRSGNNELFDALEDCLRRLSEPLRQAVNRYYYQDDAGQDAASSLGIDPSALRKRLQRARQVLRDCLQHKLPTLSNS